jgi:hypothetical protein
LPVDRLADLHGELRSYRLSGGLVANRYAEGPETWYPEILALYDEVHSWIMEARCTPVGPPREIWHNAPSDPEPLRASTTKALVSGNAGRLAVWASSVGRTGLGTTCGSCRGLQGRLAMG